ncbi:hypothetical protein ASU3_06110 [Actinobacillus suis]|nr:hypothetical protein ASU3_06110 [Actinobacillus suis]
MLEKVHLGSCMNEKHLKSLNEIYKLLESHRIESTKTELYDANRFNPFQFITTDENGLSRIMSFFLDPLETHGQQDLFLNSFLKYLKLHKFLSYDKASIYCEKLTTNKRRHDIFLEGWMNNKLTWVISIENKLKDAKDQAEQLTDYYKDLKNFGVPFFLIYLPRFKRLPSKESIPEIDWEQLSNEHKAIVLEAKDIIKWLEQTPILAPKIKNFTQDFIRFLKEEIMHETHDSNKFLDQIIKNSNWIYTATSLIENSNNLYEKLDNLLIQQLQQKLENEFPIIVSFGWHFNTNGHSTGFYLDKGDVDIQPWGVGIEFESSNCKNAYYGIWAHKLDLSEEKYKQLDAIFTYSDFRNSKWWLNWKWCDKSLQNWDAETWKNVITGELSNQIFDLLKPFIIDINHHINELEKLSCK